MAKGITGNYAAKRIMQAIEAYGKTYIFIVDDVMNDGMGGTIVRGKKKYYVRGLLLNNKTNKMNFSDGGKQYNTTHFIDISAKYKNIALKNATFYTKENPKKFYRIIEAENIGEQNAYLKLLVQETEAYDISYDGEFEEYGG